MKIFALTDIHGRRFNNPDIALQISATDLILIAGDITNFGSEEEAEPIIDQFFRLNSNILAVSGNCDQPGVSLFLEKRGISVEGKIKRIENLLIFGFGGSNKTPFATPQEYSEEEISKILMPLTLNDKAQFKIFLSHTPPYGTRLDRTHFGLQVGSKIVRDFIEQKKPEITICGHIHEARGSDRLGETLIINPGPFPSHYAVINLTDRIEFELY